MVTHHEKFQLHICKKLLVLAVTPPEPGFLHLQQQDLRMAD